MQEQNYGSFGEGEPFKGRMTFQKLQSCLEQDQLQERHQKKVGNTPTCDFDIKHVKVESHHMTKASFHISTTLSMLGCLDPYWESQLLMEYYKDLFTCKVLDGQAMDGKYKVVDGIIYVHDQIYLPKYSKLKNKLLNTTYEVLLSNPNGFIRTYHTILDGFMWENFKEEMHSHMSKCMDHFWLKRNIALGESYHYHLLIHWV